MTESIEEIKNKILDFKDIKRVKVRFNDTDAMGIVHFKNYMVYFDDGFVSFMNNLSLLKRIEDTVKEGIVCGVKHVDITYEGSARFGDYVLVKTQVKKLGNTTMTFYHEILKESDNSLLVKVICTRFLMDLNTNSLITVSNFLSKFMK